MTDDSAQWKIPYRAYVKKYGTTSKTGVTPKIYRKVLKEFNMYLVQQIVEGKKVELPCGLGWLEISKHKPAYKIENGKLNTVKLPVDWEKTNAYWKKDSKAAAAKKVLFHTNDHTDGFRYKIYWQKSRATVHVTNYYSLKPARAFSRLLAVYLKDPDTVKNYTEKC